MWFVVSIDPFVGEAERQCVLGLMGQPTKPNDHDKVRAWL